MSADRDSKVIGYYALASIRDIVCSGGGCVIAGFEVSLQAFVEGFDVDIARTCTIHKARFGEIVAALKRGAPYAFEEASWARFFPLAVEVGLPGADLDFAAARARGECFLIFHLLRA